MAPQQINNHGKLLIFYSPHCGHSTTYMNSPDWIIAQSSNIPIEMINCNTEQGAILAQTHNIDLIPTILYQINQQTIIYNRDGMMNFIKSLY